MPCRSDLESVEVPSGQMRVAVMHEWRSKADEVFSGTLGTVEPLVEGAWAMDGEITISPQAYDLKAAQDSRRIVPTQP